MKANNACLWNGYLKLACMTFKTWEGVRWEIGNLLVGDKETRKCYDGSEAIPEGLKNFQEMRELLSKSGLRGEG